MIVFHSFGAYGKLTKSQLFVIDSFKWFPEGFGTWMMERDKRPGAAKLRENRDCMHEVAAKLIEDKKQELKDGTSRKDLLSSLSSCRVSLIDFDTRHDIHCSSQGKFRSATRLAIERRRNCPPN